MAAIVAEVDGYERSCYSLSMVTKGERTRNDILDTALLRALQVGLEGLSIGPLAADVGMSKSGLFANFGSKEGLQVAVLEHAATQFVDGTVRPALSAPRGEPRVRALFVAWLDWAERGVSRSGGCLFSQTAWEYDDRPGPVRDRLSQILGDWVGALARAADIARQQGHFRVDLDPDSFAQHLHGLQLAFHLHARLFRDPAARRRAEQGFEILLADARA